MVVPIKVIPGLHPQEVSPPSGQLQRPGSMQASPPAEKPASLPLRGRRGEKVTLEDHPMDRVGV